MVLTYTLNQSMSKKNKTSRYLTVLSLFLVGFFQTSCAYQVGVKGRTLPGGYSVVEVPLFKNSSTEPGAEVAFTNSLIQEFEKNKVAAVQHEGGAPVVIRGEITNITYKPTGPIQKSEKAPLLPDETVLATGYRVIMTSQVSLVEKATGKVLWTSELNGESFYSSPQVTVARVNSVNPLYNLSARRRVIETIAQDLMVEAHDRMTENF
jgi:hypothetical protein